MAGITVWDVVVFAGCACVTHSFLAGGSVRRVKRLYLWWVFALKIECVRWVCAFQIGTEITVDKFLLNWRAGCLQPELEKACAQWPCQSLLVDPVAPL